MISQERAFQLTQDAFNSLRRGGLLDREVVVDMETVLLGQGSPLDSIAFVTFVADMEDRISRETGEDVFLVIDEIHEYNEDVSFLSIGSIARYIAKKTL